MRKGLKKERKKFQLIRMYKSRKHEIKTHKEGTKVESRGTESVSVQGLFLGKVGAID